MGTEKSLKAKNGIALWTFFLFNVALLLLLIATNSVYWTNLGVKFFFSLRTASLVVAYIIVFVLNGQLSANSKARLVFWRWKDPLPGCRAFSEHCHTDPRINLDVLTRLHGNLPNLPHEQNRLWYRIYKSHGSDLIVERSHREFLLARDMTGMAFLFSIGVGLPSFFLSDWPWNLIYVAVLLVSYLLMRNLAQNHGNRFVTNVLALESVK